jgi:hypothetical protein
MREDRRHAPRDAAPRITGRRSTDPTLTTRDCADRLGVSTGFIVGEIRAGRLAAFALKRRHRTTYRVAPADLAAYIVRNTR